jgi:sterol desaturase/sphingolipid hydroxylase (fatty acid hydroxylase superfamily)
MGLLKSIGIFIITNIYMLLFGAAQSYTTLQLMPLNFFYKLVPYQIILLLKNYTIMKIIEYGTKHKPDINENNKPEETYSGEFHVNVFNSTCIETLTLLFVQYYYFTTPIHFNIINDLLLFIPISFMFEVIFDFFHYVNHRVIHSHPILYKYIHKKHHKFSHPTPIITFYQEQLDLVLTNSIPTILTLCIIPKITYFQYILILLYKTFIEISGHCGKKLYPTSSFIQFMWLPKLLCIELYTEDHDNHHSKNNCNYSKRFSLWDKTFDTYI